MSYVIEKVELRDLKRTLKGEKVEPVNYDTCYVARKDSKGELTYQESLNKLEILCRDTNGYLAIDGRDSDTVATLYFWEFAENKYRDYYIVNYLYRDVIEKIDIK